MDNIAYLPDRFDFTLATTVFTQYVLFRTSEIDIVVGSLPDKYNEINNMLVKAQLLKMPHKYKNLHRVTKDIILCDSVDDNTRYLITNKEYMGLPERATQTFTGITCGKLSFVNVIGKNTKSTWEMFSDCKIRTLDISGIYAPNVDSVYQMFYGSYIEELELGKFMGCKASSFNGMFAASVVDKVDITRIDFSNLQHLEHMFYDAVIRSVDLSNIPSHKNITTDEMLYRARIGTIIYPKDFLLSLKLRFESAKAYHYDPDEIKNRLRKVRQYGLQK